MRPICFSPVGGCHRPRAEAQGHRRHLHRRVRDACERAGWVRIPWSGHALSDVIESASVHGPAVVIKSHHNVGGLPERMNFKLVEPLRDLFKDEVRRVGQDLGLEREFVVRQPFPDRALRFVCSVRSPSRGSTCCVPRIVLSRTRSAARDGMSDCGRVSRCCCRCRVSASWETRGTYEYTIAIRLLKAWMA